MLLQIWVLENVLAPSYHHHRQVGKRTNVTSSASLRNLVVQGKNDTVWTSPKSWSKCHRLHWREIRPQQGATLGVTFVYVSTLYTRPNYALSFHKKLEWPYCIKRTSIRQGRSEIEIEALPIEADYSLEAQWEAKHTMYRHNHQQTFNNILVHTLSRQTRPCKRSR